MHKELAKILYEYNEQKQYANEKFVYRAISAILNSLKLNNYVDRIIVESSNLKSDRQLNHYDFSTYTLNIDLPYMSHYTNNNIHLFNAEVLNVLLHESDHIKLYKEIDDNIQNIDVLISKKVLELDGTLSNNKNSLINIKKHLTAHKSYKEYLKNHDMSPIEIRANVSSYISIRQILNLIKEENDIKAYYDDLFSKTVINNYTLSSDITNSPSLDYIHKIDKKYNIDLNEQYSTIYRILCGLYLTKDEYTQIKKLTTR